MSCCGLWRRERRAIRRRFGKWLSVDGHVLRTGAANFLPSGLKRQDNDLIVIKDTQAAAKFSKGFPRRKMTKCANIFASNFEYQALIDLIVK
jgi:phosphatidylserine/phosphatidylglycerophosphate/cardiolipin synthase-like enzyme